jgi:phosphomannomutase
MTAIRFGTDGWRGVIAEEFTFANVARVAQATADHWESDLARQSARADETGASGGGAASPVPPKTVRRRLAVVGYDRRFLSPEFAQLTAEVFAGNGFDVVLTSVATPTPAVSLAVKRLRAAGGVMITASHNPAAFNGFKLKAWFGGSADPALCQAVEARLDRSPVRRRPLAEAVKAGCVRLRDLRPAHYRAVRRLVDFECVAASRLRVAHDAMWGVGAGCFEALLADTTCRVATLRGAHDPLFGGIRPEPIPRFYGSTTAWLRRHPHDVGLVSDGDADRLGALDEQGRPLTTHQVMALVLWHLAANRGGRGTVVKSLNTTTLVDRIAAAHGLPVVVTGIGFKHIGARLLEPGVLVGLEESGSLGFPSHLPERDGLAAGLLLLELLARERRPLSAILRGLERRFGVHRYARLDLTLPAGRGAAGIERLRGQPPARLLGSPVVAVQDFDGVKFTARDGSWLMLRGSGTEPVLRVYAEAATQARAHQLTRMGAGWVAER